MDSCPSSTANQLQFLLVITAELARYRRVRTQWSRSPGLAGPHHSKPPTLNFFKGLTDYSEAVHKPCVSKAFPLTVPQHSTSHRSYRPSPRDRNLSSSAMSTVLLPTQRIIHCWCGHGACCQLVRTFASVVMTLVAP